jgi:hypothetical protein
MRKQMSWTLGLGSVNARHTFSGASGKSFSTMIDSVRLVALR